ncbi:hypothetical protein GF325_17865 [Candidatus Bathyarchaeota archaeon]|nr:hypothetical protein [Candidatus Bathyarchaeota archaeon]
MKTMTHRRIFLSGFLGLLALVLSLPIASGSVAQYFPQQGTVLQYKLSHGFLSTTGEYTETDKFDVYNDSSRFYFRPSVYNFPFPGGSYNSVANDSTVKVRHEYLPNTMTEWLRVRSFVINGVEYNLASLSMDAWIYDSNNSYYPIDDNSQTVDKFGFFINTRINDYINKTAGLGELAYNFYEVIYIDSHQIIALWNYTQPTYTVLNTIVAGANGRVSEFTRGFYSDAYASFDIHSTYVIYTSTDSLGFKFTTDIILFLIGGLVGGLIIGVAAGYLAGKRKR